ncbi:hypothetical protein [Chlamydia sp. 17-3921]|uniref:hypothetical protein n=1 Tax=Chlamydia sp. 17-3921 TaxID=2675798 RepID=UPI001F4578FB|nr:hypothetical protein [Chlamydia sp. 17-3921]
MTLACSDSLLSSQQYQAELLAASRSVVMIATSLIFFLFAMILCGLSFLPQVTLPFSGAYFVVGSSLIFVALGILLVNTAYDMFLI